MRRATIAEAAGSAGCAPLLFGKQPARPGAHRCCSGSSRLGRVRTAAVRDRGEPLSAGAFTSMGRRRVRWRNVARLAWLVAAGVLIATHASGGRPPRPQTPPPQAAELPQLAGVPRLWHAQRVKRRASRRDRPRLATHTVHYRGRSPSRRWPRDPSPRSATPPPPPAASSRRTRGPSVPLRLDVGELVVHPVARVARGDDALLALRSPAALLGGHREGPMDRVGLLLHVERVNR